MVDARLPTAYLKMSRAFDAVAADYDSAYGAPDGAPDATSGNAVMAWMRQENLALLRVAFPSESLLLELGCGTGDEAIALARQGHTVLATDISPGMAACTLAKARAAGISDRVRAVALPAGGLAALQPAQPFDGAYASFGGLNCEPNLPAVARELARVVRPGGTFVTSVMGPTCLFEIAWYLLHAQPHCAFRRLHRGWVPAPVAGREGVEVSVPTRYLSVHDIRQGFTPYFAVESVMALPLFLPPPYADTLFRRRHALFVRVLPVETHLRERWPWRCWGDHEVIVLRRVKD